MRLAFLGKSSDSGESPTLYATDHESYVIQGYRVADPELLAEMDVPSSKDPGWPTRVPGGGCAYRTTRT